MRQALMAATALIAAACSSGNNTSSSTAPPVPAPVDAVGVFASGSMSYRFAPETTGYVGGGELISDGSQALGGWHSDTQGEVLEYRFTGDPSMSGSLRLRRYLSSSTCSGSDTGTQSNNASFALDNFILTNDSTSQECRGGAAETYDAAFSEYPAKTVADLVGSYASTLGPASDQGAFDAGGNRFTFSIASNGSVLLNGTCAGTIALVEPHKSVADVSGVSAACGDSSGSPIQGLVAFNGSDLLIFLIQPGSYHFWAGTLQKQ